ncbi:agmatine deiminase family protein [Bradyrhizobium jicamae]|uniref:Agmatine deiminase family protein n=1 Tax=Bradyrhizobium jicamae TaxID=280332 RepID=A0ABS5FME0_9BRAD|nr:agmatine deiminase family protein [Bradyrhizobium jicamae]MBR0797974.1 agmatine deiminase family protein [Bradyrhizobium jicamae]
MNLNTMQKERCLSTDEPIRIPAEWEPHACCFMAWAVHREWEADIDNVKRELHEVISTVAEYEPVRLLVPPDLIREAQRQNFGHDVEIIEAPVDDIWMRDILPTFALRNGAPIAIDWNFNGWGSSPLRPARPGDRLSGLSASALEIPSVPASFIADAGSIVTDGRGTVITTKSCLLRPNRNPPFGRTDRQRMDAIEQGFLHVGIRKVIWLEGDATEPITNGHADGYVLFTNTGNLLVEGIDPLTRQPNRSRQADVKLLEASVDAQNRLLDVKIVLPPRQQYLRFSGRSFASCYLNAYVANGAVITARFGDPERDEAARQYLQQAFPTREIRMLRINHIAAGGGGIHCLTKEMPQTIAT